MSSWRLASFTHVAHRIARGPSRLHRPWMQSSDPQEIDKQRTNTGTKHNTMPHLPFVRHSGHQLEQCRKPARQSASQWTRPNPREIVTDPDSNTERGELTPSPWRCHCCNVSQSTNEEDGDKEHRRWMVPEHPWAAHSTLTHSHTTLRRSISLPTLGAVTNTRGPTAQHATRRGGPVRRARAPRSARRRSPPPRACRIDAESLLMQNMEIPTETMNTCIRMCVLRMFVEFGGVEFVVMQYMY